jgi:hypothetical protein
MRLSRETTGPSTCPWSRRVTVAISDVIVCMGEEDVCETIGDEIYNDSGGASSNWVLDS